ncbi:IclR family transcriptional regulator [Arcanobacterium ihumii]|uniref:IclR family transcriptional regulator n=1 Tax=Arcanobacterium ihumii TaxID=2138162 RepID=UPI000F52D692|nr:IclR family transcriptional regulator [Arcanobacterium ihumii]
MELVKRTLDILKTLSAQEYPLTLSEISAFTNIPVSSLHRIISVLQEENFVVRANDKRYTLGPEAIGLIRGGKSLDEAAPEILSNLSEQSHETVFLSRLVGKQVRCLYLHRGTRPVTLAVRTGDELPLHASAGARVILSDLPQDRISDFFDESKLVKFTDRTLTDLTRIRAHLKVIHERGYDVCYNEINAGVLVVSAPIVGPHGDVSASVSMAGAVIDDCEAEALVSTWLPQVQEAASAISGLWCHE